MKMKWVITVLLAVPLALHAQEVKPVKDGDESLSVLYRGRLASSFTFRYNGTYYVDPEGFKAGEVMYNGKLYSGVETNLDAYQQLLCVKPKGDYAPLTPERDQVAWFTRGDQLFVNLRYLGFEQASEGFFEVIHDGETPVVKQVMKYLESNPGDKNGEVIGYYADDYSSGVITYFRYAPKTWFIGEDGSLTRLKSKRDVAKRFKNRKSEIREYVKNMNLEDVSTDVYVPLVMSMLDPSRPDSGMIHKRMNQWHPGGNIGSEPTIPVKAPAGSGRDLPAGYFDEVKESAERLSDNNISVTYQNKLYIIGTRQSGASRATITGTVTDAENGEPLPGVVVFDDRTSTYARTNSSGRYSITLPVGENYLNFNETSKEDLHINIQLDGSGGLDVVMSERITALKPAVVSAESMANHRTTEMGIEKVSMKTISKIPTAFGEGDILKAVMTLPGVKSVGEASGGFNVRGGASDQNLILFNGNTIYNPTHMFGIFSSFNPDIVENVELYKSSIPAEYGGRISSVLSVKSKDGNPEKVTGSLGIGLLTSRFHIEGPINRGKTTFILGGRMTYSDWILKRLPEESNYHGGKAGFGDANLGITHKFDESNSLRLSAYWAKDRFAFSEGEDFNYSNLDVSLAWKHDFEDPGHNLRVSASYDGFVNTFDIYKYMNDYSVTTNINQGNLKAVIRKPLSDAHVLSYGAEGVFYALDPGIMKPLNDSSLVAPRSLDREYAVEAAAFASDTYTISEKLSFEAGLRLSGFMSASKMRFYGIPELRLSGKYSPKENISLKAGFNTLRQYIHLISNTSAISPMDTWKLSDASIKPTDGYQAALGGYWTSLDTGIDFSLETYWKNMYNYLDYKSGAELTMNDNLAEALVPVKGKAYGVEFMIKKTTGKLNGWASYTYSRTFLREMTDRGVATINGGDWYQAPYDKPHDLKVALNYAFTHRYSISLNLDYSTGRPVTIPIGSYLYDGGYRLAYSERNAYRIPDYFRLDAAINIDPGHYLKALTHSSITIGVYNLTGRKNPYSVYYTTDGGFVPNGYMVSVFATQIPYINFNLIF